MDAKKLRRMKRAELLELMLAQSREIDRLNAQVSELETQLANRNVAISSSGNLAEAALKLTGIFEDAQRAVDIYLHNATGGAVSQTSDKASRGSVTSGTPVARPAVDQSYDNPVAETGVSAVRSTVSRAVQPPTDSIAIPMGIPATDPASQQSLNADAAERVSSQLADLLATPKIDPLPYNKLASEQPQAPIDEGGSRG